MKIFCDNCMGDNEVDEAFLDQQGYRAECRICGHMIFLDSDTIDAIMIRKKTKKEPSPVEKKHVGSLTRKPDPFDLSDSVAEDITSTLAVEKDHKEAKTTPAELAVIEGPDAGLVVTMNMNRLVFGRKGADINLNDRLVSRRHAAIEAGSGRYLLKDLGSTNGTFLNGHTAGMEFLKHGDEIQMGSTLIRFRIVGMESDVVIFR